MYIVSKACKILAGRLKEAALLFSCIALACLVSVRAQSLKVAVAGMTHGHVAGLLSEYKKGAVDLTGIAEKDKALIKKYQARFQLPDSLFFDDLAGLLQARRPDVVLAYNATAEHLAVVELCAPLHIHVMVEKPLATTVEDAGKIAALSRRHGIQVLTNYETTWYASNQELYERVHSDSSFGIIRKMIAHDGHAGPKEIGVGKEFLDWLTDPTLNGGGALFDFGCYGANLMTWLMKGEAPIAVTAFTRQYKPAIYDRVDDDATIIVEYKNAVGIIEASWNWPFSIKDLEVFGTKGYLQAVNGTTLRSRYYPASAYTLAAAKPELPVYKSNVDYLAALLKDGRAVTGHELSSLENNLMVVRILAAARESAKKNKRIVLK